VRHIGGTATVCWKPGSETEAWASARAQGGQARWNSSPRPRGRARQRPRPSPGGSGETEFVPEPRKVERLSYSFLQFFIPLIWVSYFMVPNNMALALAQYEDLF